MRPLVVIVLLVAGSACGRIGFDAIGDDGSIVINAEVPFFQAGTRLRPYVADFGGGAREHVSWFDTALDARCSPGNAGDGSRRCLPSATNLVFTDAACTERVGVWVTQPGMQPPRWATELEGSACASRSRLFTLGSEIAPQMYYTRASGTCLGPYALGAMSQLLAITEETPVETFAELVELRVGTGRLQASGWQGDDGAIDLRAVYDTVLGASCEVTNTADGPRCVPRGTLPRMTEFADASCTTPLVSARGPCTQNDYVRIEDTCRGYLRTHERGAAWTGPVYALSGATCTETTTTDVLTSLGPEVPPSTFIDGLYYDEPQTGRLVGVGWLALDATRVRQIWRDTQRGDERCGLAQGTTVGGPRCVPRSELATAFRDNACAIPFIDASCTADYVLASDTRGVTLHAIEPTAPQPTARYTYAASCTQATFDASRTYLVGGPALSFDVFALGTIVLD